MMYKSAYARDTNLDFYRRRQHMQPQRPVYTIDMQKQGNYYKQAAAARALLDYYNRQYLYKYADGAANAAASGNSGGSGGGGGIFSSIGGGLDWLLGNAGKLGTGLIRSASNIVTAPSRLLINTLQSGLVQGAKDTWNGKGTAANILSGKGLVDWVTNTADAGRDKLWGTTGKGYVSLGDSMTGNWGYNKTDTAAPTAPAPNPAGNAAPARSMYAFDSRPQSAPIQRDSPYI